VDKGLALWSALGRRERRDMDEVARLWLCAAEAGFMHGQHNIGCLYAQGNGVEQSDTTAVAWFSKAADQGEMHAMYDLARMHVLGRGVDQSDEEAAKWCKLLLVVRRRRRRGCCLLPVYCLPPASFFFRLLLSLHSWLIPAQNAPLS
jgi:hypothetical protein